MNYVSELIMNLEIMSALKYFWWKFPNKARPKNMCAYFRMFKKSRVVGRD